MRALIAILLAAALWPAEPSPELVYLVPGGGAAVVDVAWAGLEPVGWTVIQPAGGPSSACVAHGAGLRCLVVASDVTRIAVRYRPLGPPCQPAARATFTRGGAVTVAGDGCAFLPDVRR